MKFNIKSLYNHICFTAQEDSSDVKDSVDDHATHCAPWCLSVTSSDDFIMKANPVESQCHRREQNAFCFYYSGSVHTEMGSAAL